MVIWLAPESIGSHTKAMVRHRRLLILIVSLGLTLFAVLSVVPPEVPPQKSPSGSAPGAASQALESLPVKGRAAKTGYSRDEFGSGWKLVNGCDSRQIILFRDLTQTVISDECTVLSGVLNDPYTATSIRFNRQKPDAVQIDHVVALSDAWQKGAQQLSRQERIALANDPLELLAVDGPANQEKSDSDAASWLPPNKSFRCEYVARQIAIKQKYQLWVTEAEKRAMQSVLEGCPAMSLPG